MNTAFPNVVLFEDERAGDLGPIVDTRPAFELRCGALNLRERVELALGSPPRSAVVRAHLSDLAAHRLPSPDDPEATIVAVNARLAGAVANLRRAVEDLGDGDEVRRDGALWLARIPAADLAGSSVVDPSRPDVGSSEGLMAIDRPWSLVTYNDRFLAEDFDALGGNGAPARTIFGVEFEAASRRAPLLAAEPWVDVGGRFAGAHVIRPERVRAARSAIVRPGAVIDAENGPVILSPGVVVHPLSVVVGPAYLGPGTVVNPGARLREGTSLGAFCKVGGEIEESVVLDLSNKQHDGFLGHALLGSWVNLGADTNGSDLKNNYGSVRVDLGRGPVDTGEAFVGQHLGDHVKTGIDTMLTTGGVVGVGGNVFGAGFAPRFVPAFAWGGVDGLSEYRWDDAIRTARTVLARRDVVWSDDYETMLRAVFDATAHQR